MRVLKRTSLAAVAVLALGAGALIATPAYAAEVSTVIDGVTYTADDTNAAAGATATDFDHSTTAVTIPDSVDIAGTSYNVVAIGGSAFTAGDGSGTIINGDITSVVIGNNVTWIAAQAFMSNKISSLTLGTSLNVISGSAFMGNNLTEITIPTTVTTIKGYAFASNPSLTSVVFTGPAPSDIAAGNTSSLSFDNSASGFVISFPEEFSAEYVAGGYTEPEWEGYATQAISEFSITKTVDASFVREYDWMLEKAGTVGGITVGDENASADVDFTVTATPNGYTDSYYVLSGEITVTNETVEPRNVTVTDEPEIGINASCTVETLAGDPATDLSLAGNESLTLTYFCNLDGVPEDGTNTATVSWGDAESSSVTEDVVFTQRGTNFETVTVGDDHASPDNGFSELGTVTWNSDHLPFNFGYTTTLENLPLGECTSVTNTAIIYEMERTANTVVEICPEGTSAPEVTPVADPKPASLAQTGTDHAGGVLAIAVLLLLTGGTALMVNRRMRHEAHGSPRLTK